MSTAAAFSYSSTTAGEQGDHGERRDETIVDGHGREARRGIRLTYRLMQEVPASTGFRRRPESPQSDSDNRYQSKPLSVTVAVWWGVKSLGSTALAIGRDCRGRWLLFAIWCRRRDRHALIVPLAWVGIIALAWYAFYQGHPYRIRYMVPAVAASSILLGLAVGQLRRWQAPVAAALLALVWLQARPFDPKAAMVLEAQWDRPRGVQRRAVTAVPAAARPRRDRDGEHGRPRALHAGIVGRGLRAARLPARGQRRSVGRRSRAPDRAGALDDDRGGVGRRRHARANVRGATRRSSKDSRASAKAAAWRSIRGKLD